MAGRAAQLAIELTEKGAADVAGGFDRVTASAKDMGNTVETASKQADQASSRIDGTAEASDELASKGAQAAGAMSGLGDLIGGPFGAAMQSGGIALQAAADSGDLLNAALENSIVTGIRSKAATVARTVAEKASTVVTKGMTVAQKALNLAQRASPIGLIITGVLLLVGALVLAYKRSQTFRSVVQGALSVVRGAVDKVKAGFQALGPAVRAVMSFIATVVRTYIRVYVTAFQLVFRGAQVAWNGIKAAASATIGWLIDRASDIRSKVAGAFDFLKSRGKAAFDALVSPIQRIVDLIDSILDKISKIHVPHIDVNPFNRSGGSTTLLVPATAGGTPVAASQTTITLEYHAAAGTDTATATGQAQAMMDAIDQRLTLVGRKPVFRR